MPDTEKPIMWNGGTTNKMKEKAIKKLYKKYPFLNCLNKKKKLNVINKIPGYGWSNYLNEEATANV